MEIGATINQFLSGQIDISSKIAFQLIDMYRGHETLKLYPSVRSSFFLPYQSTTDAFFRAAAVATAPVAWSICTVECLVDTVITALMGIYIFMIGNPDNEQGYFLPPIEHLVETVIASLMVITSPIINLVDFIGSGFTTVMQETQTQASRAP